MAADRVLAIDRLFHYVLQPHDGLVDEIVRNGLRPLSDLPTSDRWVALQRHRPGFFEDLYDAWARPVLGRPYPGRSGIFLTPIDFRRLPGIWLADRPRVAVPLDLIDRSWSCLTYGGDCPRTTLPLSPETLEEAAAYWSADRVRRWFGRDSTKLFYDVPQVVTYQPHGVPVGPADVEN